MVPDRIEREILIEAPPDVVWSAITEPEHVSKWFGDAAEIDLRPGGEASFTWDDGGTAHARIETVEPPHRLVYRWMRWPIEHPTGAGLDEGNSTLVEFTLAAEGRSTRLRVVESGFRALDVPAQAVADYAEENTTGWPKELAELREYVMRR